MFPVVAIVYIQSIGIGTGKHLSEGTLDGTEIVCTNDGVGAVVTFYSPTARIEGFDGVAFSGYPDKCAIATNAQNAVSDACLHPGCLSISRIGGNEKKYA